MVNNPIQEERMKNYFIQATKEIIKSEGIKALSVRNIAQQAGYSYATLYNYFKDIKELIFKCVQDFQEECKTEILEEIKNLSPGPYRLKKILHGYIKFFIQYPGIFDLFYIEKMSDIGQEKTARLITNFLNELCQNEWEPLKESHNLNTRQLVLLENQLNFMVTGILLFYINRRQPASYQEFQDLATTQINELINHIL